MSTSGATAEPFVEITRHGVDRIRGGHLWVYRSDVARTSDVSPGDVVRLVDGRGWFLGRAFYSQSSQITLRILTTEDVPIDRAFFAQRLDLAVSARERMLPGVDAARLVHGEADLLPGLIVDRYADVLAVQTLSQGTDARSELFYDLLQERLAPRSIVERNDAKVRNHEGLALRTGVVRGEAPGTVVIHEGDVAFEVDPVEGQKTGAFLDQRENRLAVGRYVRPGDRCLDVFAYNGGFALQMARAGGQVTAVEISDRALQEARSAAERNGLTIDTVEANAFDWLKAHSLEGVQWDVINLDPPAFARSKSALEGATRGYKEINLRAMQMLAPGGWLVTSSCSYHMAEEHLLEIVLSAANDAGRRMQLIEKRGPGRDHPSLMGVRETSYLKCFILRRVD